MQELEYEGATITVITPPMIVEGSVIKAIEHEQESFVSGAVDMVNGSLQMVRALVKLKQDGLYKQSPLVAHYDTPPGWMDYLRELVAWAKERNSELQISMSGLQNGLWRYKVLVDYFGIDEHEALGMNEALVRKIRSMASFDYRTGEPKALKDGYKESLLPVPPDTPAEERLAAGLKTVIQDAVAQPVVSLKMFDDYKSGTGQIETTVDFSVSIVNGRLVAWVAFIKQFDEEGRAKKDYAVNLLGQEWPYEVAEKLGDAGWSFDYD